MLVLLGLRHIKNTTDRKKVLDTSVTSCYNQFRVERREGPASGPHKNEGERIMSIKDLNKPLTYIEACDACKRENRYFPGHRVVNTTVGDGQVCYTVVYTPSGKKSGKK